MRFDWVCRSDCCFNAISQQTRRTSEVKRWLSCCWGGRVMLHLTHGVTTPRPMSNTGWHWSRAETNRTLNWIVCRYLSKTGKDRIRKQSRCPCVFKTTKVYNMARYWTSSGLKPLESRLSDSTAGSGTVLSLAGVASHTLSISQKSSPFLPRCNAVQLRESCLSVRPSVKRVDYNKTEETSLQIFIPYERSFTLVLWEELLVGATTSTWNFGSMWPRWSEIADFQLIFARRVSAVTSSEKSSININRKSNPAVTSKRYEIIEIGCQLLSIAYGLLIGTDVGDLEWPWTA